MDENLETTAPNAGPRCEKCGSALQSLPTLDGSGVALVCPQCAPGPTPVQDEPHQTADHDSPQENGEHSRFKELLHSPSDPAPPDAWPEELLKELPEEARELLTQQPAETAQTPRPGTGELREELASSLRDQGFVIEEDAHGVRFSGSLSSSRAEKEPLSPYDIVRLAAELEGGVLPPEKRRICPKCEAVVPVGDDRCQMCGESVPLPQSPDQE